MKEERVEKLVNQALTVYNIGNYYGPIGISPATFLGTGFPGMQKWANDYVHSEERAVASFLINYIEDLRTQLKKHYGSIRTVNSFNCLEKHLVNKCVKKFSASL